MKNTIIIVVLSFLFFSCKSAYTRIGDKKANYIPYYLKVYEADSLFLTNNYQRSYEILDSLFKKYEPINIEGSYEYGNYLASALMTNNTKNLKSKIVYSYNEFGDIFIFHKEALDFKKQLKEKSQLTAIEIDSLKKKFKNKLKISLRTEIENMIIEDQQARIDRDDNAMKELSKKHKAQLEKLFLTHGYPNFKMLGSDNLFDNSAEIDVLLVHQDRKFHEKHLPFLLENLKKGKMTPSSYAFVFDRYFWNKSIETENKPQQYYGTYINITTGETDLELANTSKIDSIRKSIGLPNLYYPYWRYKYEY